MKSESAHTVLFFFKDRAIAPQNTGFGASFAQKFPELSSLVQMHRKTQESARVSRRK